jgi:hypothetical protein
MECSGIRHAKLTRNKLSTGCHFILINQCIWHWRKILDIKSALSIHCITLLLFIKKYDINENKLYNRQGTDIFTSKAITITTTNNTEKDIYIFHFSNGEENT